MIGADVRFIVVGGLAVNVHGLLRMTLDIDLVVELSPANVVRAFTALGESGYHPVIPVSAAEFADAPTRAGWVRERDMRVLRFYSDEHPQTPVVVFAFEPFPFDQEYQRAVLREVSGVGGVRVVSLPTLFRMKQEAARPQDLADIDSLRLRGDRDD